MNNKIAPVPRQRRITEADARNISELVAKRLSESEACRVLKINAHSWRQWKRRNKNDSEFAGMIEEVRGQKIKAAMENIESSGKTDWRASDRLLAHLDSARFNDRRAPLEITVTGSGFDAETRRLAMLAVFGDRPLKQISDSIPVRQISAPSRFPAKNVPRETAGSMAVPLQISQSAGEHSEP
jgi:hypothetical protein